jgi:hypothetical protein
LRHKKERTTEKANKVDKCREKKYIFLSLYPKISAIASGATPIGSADAHPIEKSRQRKGGESKLMIKNKVDGHEA